MEAVVVGYAPWRVKRYLTERKIAESLVRLGYEVTAWCPESEKEESIPVWSGEIKISPYPPHTPSVIFWVTGPAFVSFPLKWIERPIFFVVNDWYKEGWPDVHAAMEIFLKLKEKGHCIHFIALSPANAEKIKEVNPSIIIGRVSDEIFLFPEELCVKKTPAPLLSWLGNRISTRTYQEVWQYLIDSFPHMTFFFGDKDDPPFALSRNCVWRKDLSFIKSLQVIYRSAALLAPYVHTTTTAPPMQGNPIKYWDAVALNTPFVASNVALCENAVGAHTIITNDAQAVKDFFAGKVSDVSKDPNAFIPFSDAEELRKWRMKNNFTRQLAVVMREVLGEEWEFPPNFLLQL